MEGWIKIHRKILENPIICKDSDYLAVWIYLLLNATHKEIPALFKGKKIILQKGQLITGRKSIASQLKISESKIFRIINDFKSEQQIEQQTSNKNSLISILNWDKYQNIEQQNEQQMNNKRTTDEQQVNTNKNVKNVKNVRNIYKDLSENFSLALNDFIEMRNKMKKPMTKRAIELLINKIKKISDDEEEQIAIINQSIERGWQTVYPLKNNLIYINSKKSGADIWLEKMKEKEQKENEV